MDQPAPVSDAAGPAQPSGQSPARHRLVLRRGLRWQSTVAAVAVVAIAILAGGLLLLLTLQSALLSGTDSVLHTKVQDVAALIRSQDAAEASLAVASTLKKDPAVQIINSAGKVIGASEPRLLSTPLSELRPPAGTDAAERLSAPALLGDADVHYVVVLGLDDGGEMIWVLGSQTIQPQSDAVRTVMWFLLIAMPLLLGVVGLAVYFLVGRSLRQVDTIREQVSHIGAGRLSERVDVPGTRDELQALATTMNSMLDRIETADQKQRQFVSDASHELRGPLTTLRTGLDISVADLSGETWQGMQPILTEETERLQALVEDLLSLSKADDPGMAVRREDVDLDDVLASELRRLKATSKHRIVAHIVPVKVEGDPVRLGQVFRNVLDNAERHATGTIVAELTVAARNVVVTIDDDGRPVPVADRERIFGRFVRLDESRARHQGGSGLGLAIARGITEAHGGRLISTETARGWCRFEICLPSVGSALTARYENLPASNPKRR
jgi:signal transduction histidine kinase